MNWFESLLHKNVLLLALSIMVVVLPHIKRYPMQPLSIITTAFYWMLHVFVCIHPSWHVIEWFCVCAISVRYLSVSLLSMHWSMLLIFKRQSNKSEGEQKRRIKRNREKEREREWLFCHLHSSTSCFPSLSQTQTVKDSDIYSINCQHNQHQYVRTLMNNSTQRSRDRGNRLFDITTEMFTCCLARVKVQLVELAAVKVQDSDHSLSLFFICLCVSESLGRRHYVFGLSIGLYHSRERIISGMPWRNFFKFGINVLLDSRMNWLDFGGQRSRSLWPHVCPILVISLELLEWIEWCMDDIFL